MMTIYILSTDTSAKSDVTRAMHENLKSVVTELSEDIIKNGISGVSESSIDICDMTLTTTNYKIGTKLCLNSLNDYYLAKEV
jgi:hypothetical protein